MATASELAELRDYINEADDTGGWDDAKLIVYTAQYGSVYATAAAIWGIKASRYAELVNTSESGSSRNLGDLFDRALKLQERYQALADAENEDPPIGDSPVVSKIRRGF